jgi:predicted esterase
VVGFSQGGATASRWIANQKSTCDNFILWSSNFPEDLNLNQLSVNNNSFVLFGDDDDFISTKQVNDYEKFLNISKTDCQLIRFKGKHDIPNDVLLEQTKLNNW